MATDEHDNSTIRNMKDESRSFRQYLLETAWSYGTGAAMAAHWLP